MKLLIFTKNWRDHHRKGTRKHTETWLKYFDGHSCFSQSEENECMWTHDKDGVTREFLKGATRGLRGMDGGKFKRKLSEVNIKAVSKRWNELVGKYFSTFLSTWSEMIDFLHQRKYKLFHICLVEPILCST